LYLVEFEIRAGEFDFAATAGHELVGRVAKRFVGLEDALRPLAVAQVDERTLVEAVTRAKRATVFV
jgi:hypothetical protein